MNALYICIDPIIFKLQSIVLENIGYLIIGDTPKNINLSLLYIIVHKSAIIFCPQMNSFLTGYK